MDKVREVDISIPNTELDKNASLWVYIPLKTENFMEQIQRFIEAGFSMPYIGATTPSGKKIPHSVCLVRKRGSKSNVKREILNVMYIIEQYKKGQDTCSMFARFSPNAISFLRKTSNMGHTKNGDGLTTQKELGGQLHVENIEQRGNKYVFVIGVDKNNVDSGEEEEVMVSPTRYNFHSHPKEAYVKHGVRYGWPSITDYLGYLKLGNNTIFHCVATLEGLYILSFGSYWVDRLNDVSKNFIKKNYDIDKKEVITPFEYVKKVSMIQYKNHPLFLVKFLPWTGASGTIFGVTYKKDGIRCEPNEKE